MTSDPTVVHAQLCAFEPFEKIIGGDWAAIVDPTVEGLTRVIENIVARLGVHIADPLDGTYVVHVRRAR